MIQVTSNTSTAAPTMSVEPAKNEPCQSAHGLKNIGSLLVPRVSWRAELAPT